jgi:hypothetical protein
MMVLEHLLEAVELRIKNSSLDEPVTLAELRIIIIKAIEFEEAEAIKKIQEENDAFDTLDQLLY